VTQLPTTTHQHLVVGDPRQQVHHLVVRHRVRPQDAAQELVGAPKHQQVPDRDQIQDDGAGEQEADCYPGQIRNGEVEGAASDELELKLSEVSVEVLFYAFQERGDTAYRVLHALGHFLDCLQSLLQALLLFLQTKIHSETLSRHKSIKIKYFEVVEACLVTI
jgi:hypothetical protein